MEQKIKILVIDDDPYILKFVSLYLERENYIVLKAVNGEEGYNIAEAEKPTVIISDIMMPKMNGFQLCEKIKNNSELRHIPFLMLTARDSNENLLEGFKYGAQDYITKPFNPIELISRVKSFVNLRLSQLEIINKNNLIEQAHKESETIFNNINEAIFVINNNLEIMKTNEVSSILLAVPKEEIIGKSYLEILNLDFKNDDYIIKTIDEKKAYPNIETTITNKNGSEIPVLLSTSYLELNNNDFLVIIVLADISEFKKVENMKNEFLSIVSHELRTPLASIKAAAETCLINKIDDEATLRQFLNIIDDEADRLTRLINEILDLAKIEADKMTFNFVKLEVVSLLKKCVALFSQYANKKNQKIITNFQVEHIYIQGDEDRFYQMISNLLSNALKFTEEGKNIYINLLCDESYVIIEIIDEGCGIKKEELENIFDKFYQVSNSLTRKVSGTGLGLPLVRAFVEVHRGKIYVSSEENKGSKFTIKIPIYSTEFSERDDVIESSDEERVHILIVDDNIDMLNSVKKILEMENYLVYKAMDGVQALEILNKKKVDIMILDLKLPNMNGYEVLRKVRETNADLPIIVLTASDLGRSRSTVLKLGANEYIQKPFTMNEFKEKIKHIKIRN